MFIVRKATKIGVFSPEDLFSAVEGSSKPLFRRCTTFEEAIQYLNEPPLLKTDANVLDMVRNSLIPVQPICVEPIVVPNKAHIVVQVVPPEVPVVPHVVPSKKPELLQLAINPFSKLNEVIVYTDGSSIYNGKPNARAGSGVYIPSLKIRIAERITGLQTNNRAELTAILLGVEKVMHTPCKKITIVSDSSYSINCVTKWLPGWRAHKWKKSDGMPVLNRDLITRIDELLSKIRTPVTFRHVRSHTGLQDDDSKGNEVADELAKEGREKSLKTDRTEETKRPAYVKKPVKLMFRIPK